VLVGQESSLYAFDVRQAGRGGAVTECGLHGGGDVNSYDAAHAGSGGQGEPPGPGAEVHQRACRPDAMVGEHGEVAGKIGISLLAVEPGDEARIEMFTPSLRQLVEHPRLGHAPILALPPERQLHHSQRVHSPPGFQRVLGLPVASHGSDQVQLARAAVDAQDGDQVALDGVHDPVRADAQPQHLAPPERLRWVWVIGQLGDCNSNGAHPGLVGHEAACRRSCRRQPLDPH
jgi:hypothetical protein